MQNFPLEQLKERLSAEQLRVVLQELNGRATARFIGLLTLLLYWVRPPPHTPPPHPTPPPTAPPACHGARRGVAWPAPPCWLPPDPSDPSRTLPTPPDLGRCTWRSAPSDRWRRSSWARCCALCRPTLHACASGSRGSARCCSRCCRCCYSRCAPIPTFALNLTRTLTLALAQAQAQAQA